MKATRFTLAVLLAAGAMAHAQQAPNLVAEVRAAIARQDLTEGERLIAAQRASTGVTPIVMEAISWLGRGALAAGQLDRAEGYARQAYDLAQAALKTRGVDDEPRLPTALGASIEVLSQAGAKRGARSEAVTFLREELNRWGGTSIARRIQKNLNLLSLEGMRAPALDFTEQVGPPLPDLFALRGKVVLLFFWAHWCGDCKTQAPVLARLLDRYGVSTTPTLVLVNREGLVRLYNPGPMTEEALDPHVRRALGGARQATAPADSGAASADPAPRPARVSAAIRTGST